MIASASCKRLLVIFHNKTFPFVITSILHAPHSFSEWLATFYGSQKLSSIAASICCTCCAKWRHAMHAVYGDKQTITTRQVSELRSTALSLRVTCFHVFIYLLHICLPAYTITHHSHLHVRK